MRALLVVLVAGFGAVIILLLAAAGINVNNARSATANAAGLVADQLVVTRLLDELEREQSVLNAAFYRLSRSPEKVNRQQVLADLSQTDMVIQQLVTRAASGPDRESWNGLRRSTSDFSLEARRLLSRPNPPEEASRDLFFRHEEVTAEVARLVDLSYSRAVEAQERVEQQSSRLARESTLLIASCLFVALLCAGLTVRLAVRYFQQGEAQAGELSRVSFRLLEVQESIARRFAHELHDELGGALTAIKTNLAGLSLNASPVDQARLDDCTHLVEGAISNVRELSQLLRPTILDDFGLDAGLRWLAARFQERTRVPVDYHSEFEGRLADETETHLFRIVQEALTNIARHAHATRVTIDLRVDAPGARGRAVRLRIADNGRGLTPSASTGMGLSGMRARARSAGGELKIMSAPGQGVTIEAWAPLAHQAKPGRPAPAGDHTAPGTEKLPA